jgi:hypothetical protein
MFVAPPGFSKTFWLEQFLRGPHAILHGTDVDVDFEGIMTEAGWSGTVRFTEGEPTITPGIAQQYDEAIIGIEEFSAVTEMMKSQHSRLLDTALLTSLDSGWCYKRLAGGKIEFQTFATLLTGTQPARFDLTSGLGRRFIFLLFIPTKKDRDAMWEARWEAKNVRFRPGSLNEIREGMNLLVREVKGIREVQWDESVREELLHLREEFKIEHYEASLFEKLLIGYTVMKGDFGRQLVLEMDNTSKRLIYKEALWREEMKRGSENVQVMTILRDNGGQMTWRDLSDDLLSFGLDWGQATALIKGLITTRAIEQKGDIIRIRKVS